MKTKTLRNHTTALLAAASFLPMLAAAPALAQDQDTVVNEQDTITVTARRREESLQDVPMSVSAFSAEELNLTGSTNIVALNETTPNVTIELSRATNSTLSAFIRGIGQQDPVAGFEAGVGIYIDDVYLNRPQAAALDIYDVERIEVLRGPQGTLYGRNTIGGAIKYVTRRLNKDRPELSAKVNVGSYSQLDAVVTGSMPLSEHFRVGASVARLGHSGFGKNLTTGANNYNKDVWAGRASVEAEAGKLSLRVSADYTEDNSNPRGGHRLIPSTLTGAPVLENVYDTRGGLNQIPQYISAKGVAGTLEYAMNDQWKLRSITSYREDHSNAPIDFDALPTVDIDVPYVVDNDQFSQELQAVYTGNKLAGVMGFYYLDAHAYNEFDVQLGAVGNLIGLPGLMAKTYGNVTTQSWSAYGNFTYDFNDALSLTLGARYTHDERDAIIQRSTWIGGYSPLFGGSGIQIATTSDFNGNNDWNRFTPQATLAYKLDEHTNVYASYSQGFKGGGFDPRGQTSATPDFNGDGTVSADEIFRFMSFDPESVNAYEVGWKVDYANYRHAFALFYSDYSDVQVPGSVGVDTNGDGIADTFTGITTNAGKATIKGIEYQGWWRPLQDAFSPGDEVTLQWSAGLLDGKYDEFIDAFGQDISSQVAIQNTPKWTLSGTLGYSAPVSSGEVTFLNTISFRSPSQQFERPSPIDEDSYALWNADLVWQSNDGHWEAGLHAKNLTDVRYKVAGYDFVTYTSLGLEGTLTGFYGDPRTVTATLKWKY